MLHPEKVTSTYKEAKTLAELLAAINPVFRIKPETLDMKTSGIFIPRWLGYSRIPHVCDKKTGTVEWYFFLRFQNKYEINVAQTLQFLTLNSMDKLVSTLQS